MAKMLCRECGADAKSNAARCDRCGARDPASSCLGAITSAAAFILLLVPLLYPKRFLHPNLTAWGYGVLVGIGVVLTLFAVIAAIARRFGWLLTVAVPILGFGFLTRLGFPNDPLSAIVAVSGALLLAASAYAFGTTRRR